MSGNSQPPLIITLDNGVKLTSRPVPIAIIQAAIKDLKKPDPPMVDIGGGRMESNPNDPEYDLALAGYYAAMLNKAYDAMALYGSVVHSLPEDFPNWDDDRWIDNLESYGVEFDRTGSGDGIDISTEGKRQVAWKKHQMFGACDMSSVYMMVKNSTFVAEQKVIDAINYFRRNQERFQPRIAEIEGSASNRNSVPADPTGDSIEIRGTESGEVPENSVVPVPIR